MKNKRANTTDASGANWQILGNLQLSVSSDVATAINLWLSELLSPLRLSTEFKDKVLSSAIEAASRAVLAETAKALAHIHFLIFAPAESKLEGQTWGFFRIEKLDHSIPNQAFPKHAIELYLYVEGE